MRTLRAAMLIAGKDLLSEARSRERAPAMLLFAVLVLLLLHFAVGLDSAEGEALAPGVLWIAILLAGTLGLYRSFAAETSQMAIHGLLLGPADRSAIYFGKTLSGSVLLFLVAALVALLYPAFFGANLLAGSGVNTFLALGLVLLCGTVGFNALGTTIAAVAASTPSRETLLPVLLFPLAAPLLIASTDATRSLLAGEPWAAPLRILVLAAVAFASISWLVFEFALEE